MATPKIEVTVAQYGTPNENGYILSHADAMKMFDQLREQETVPADEVGYYINNVRMVGDEHTGAIVAVFAFE
jgi:hypothetical protein